MDQRVLQEMADAVTSVPLVVAVSGHRILVAAEIPEMRISVAGTGIRMRCRRHLPWE